MRKIVHQELTYRDLNKELTDKLNRLTANYTLLETLEDPGNSPLQDNEITLIQRLKTEINNLMRDVEVRKEMKRLVEEKTAYTGGVLWKPDRLF